MSQLLFQNIINIKIIESYFTLFFPPWTACVYVTFRALVCVCVCGVGDQTQGLTIGRQEELYYSAIPLDQLGAQLICTHHHLFALKESFKMLPRSWAWWSLSVILVFGRLTQEEH
jgi:hypothetical protein